ncbi:MAG: aldo/keto reductase [Candidatus Cyclobacteriaceae bacterium M3_2C_046]
MENQHKYNRREFLGTLMAGVSMGSLMFSCQQDSTNGIPTRPLGKTGERVSIIGLGGWDSAAQLEDKEVVAMMQEAVDEGITFFDNSWDYHDGHSEELMGQALSQGNRRDKVFLMTKVCGRDYATAKQHLEDSLRRMKTDHLDLWQFHGIKYEDDPDLIMGENGGLKAALEAQKEGKVRFIGFTGHQHPKYHLAMLDQDYEWASVQMPTNIMDPHYTSFQKEVLPVVNKRDIAAIGMKALGAQDARISRESNIPVATCRRYALSLPISTLVCGFQNPEEMRGDIEMARNFNPLTEAEIGEILNQTEPLALDGQIEAYKVGNYGCDWYHNKA